MTSRTPDEFDIDAELEQLVLDEDFVNGGRTEAAAEERIARAQRIARGNNELRRAGEIADGTGKPMFRHRKRSLLIIGAAIAAVAIVVIALIAR